MTELAEIFAELGISQYLNDFVEQGFDTWETILDIKESDFDALNVKLGHRRKLQRKIASARGVSPDRALESPGHTPGEDRFGDEQRTPANGRNEAKDASGAPAAAGAKRKYRRHPKADENAPERPPSAYVIFSNKMREDLKGRNLSFTEIAKLVGEHWQNLMPHEKEPYESQAGAAKEKYTSEMAEYKKTENYKEYTLYLAEFKARQSNQQSVNDLDPSKRPKLEPQLSLASTGTTSSGASQQGVDTPSSRTDPGVPPWLGKDRNAQSQAATSPALSSGMGFSKNVDPSARMSPTLLPGYRDALFAGDHSSLPWRDGPRDENSTYPGPHAAGERWLGGAPGEGTRSAQQTQPPPLLKSESTNSTVSSVFYTPRTPLEPPLERGIPLPSIYANKPSGMFENQLPPLRPLSNSPRTPVTGSLVSPIGSYANPEFTPPVSSLRPYGNVPTSQAPRGDARQAEFGTSGAADEPLDPVSALLRAGEIVDRNSQRKS